mmetsp:Transcript_3144/g.8965  ORF Transcript_3144/g.8965 Transcript_3144/m.8965 type:complete len:650 (-) Transcript_3144:1602-3551(-)
MFDRPRRFDRYGGDDNFRERRSRDKVVIRRAVDYASTVVEDQAHRCFAPHPLRAAYPGQVSSLAVQPHNTYVRYTLPPRATAFNVASAVCTNPVQRPELYNFEKMMSRPTKPVTCSIWSPNGRRLICGGNASASAGGSFTLWDGATFRFENMVTAHTCGIKCIQWSHGDNYFLSSDEQGNIKYFLETCSELHTMKGDTQGAVLGLAFAPTNAKFASCGADTTVKVWDYNSHVEERVLVGHSGTVHCVDWHPDKSLLVSGEQNNLIKFWDPRDAQGGLCTLTGHNNRVNRVLFNRNGNWMASSAQDNLVMLWDLRTLKCFAELRGHTNSVTALAWHPVHEHLFCSGDYSGSLVFWTTYSTVPQAVMPRVHTASINTCSWHPAGHLLATGGHDSSMKLWARPRAGQPCGNEDNRLMFAARLQELGTTATLRTEDEETPAVDVPLPEDETAKAGAADSEDDDGEAAVAGRKRKRSSEPTDSNGPSKSDPFAESDELAGEVPLGEAFAGFEAGLGATVAKVWSRPKTVDGVSASVVTTAPNTNNAVQPVRVPRPGYVCKKCNRSGHFIQDCPLNSQPPEGYVCRICNIPGHYKRDCPRLAGQQRQGGGPGRGGPGRGGGRGDGGRGGYGGPRDRYGGGGGRGGPRDHGRGRRW